MAALGFWVYLSYNISDPSSCPPETCFGICPSTSPQKMALDVQKPSGMSISVPCGRAEGFVRERTGKI